MKRIIVACLLVLVCAEVSAEGLENLRKLCPHGHTVTIATKMYVSGIVVSDFRSENVALNPNLTEYFVDIGVNDRTVYLQEADGSSGICLLFVAPAYNRLERYDHVTFDLEGCLLERSEALDMITVSGLRPGNLVKRTPGQASDVPAKEKFIHELNDADFFTQVTLKDLDVVCKNGCWTNIYEPYAQYADKLHADVPYAINKRMDGWATLMRDSQGNTLYLLVNTLCPWRRDGNPVPQGMGNVTGVITHTPMRRYGGEMGRFSIRPIFAADIRLDAKRKASPWKTLAGWEYDGTGGQFINFEKLGIQGGVWKDGKVGDRVLSDRGNRDSYFWTDSGSAIHIDSDLDALDVQGRGYQINGVLYFKAPTVNWYKFTPEGKIAGTNSFFVEFTSKGIKGQCMQLCFSWAAGDQDADNDGGYPAQWRVQCFLGDGRWLTLKETATGRPLINLRPLPYWNKKLLDGRTVETSYDAALGMQQRCFNLPVEAFNRDKVLVRITPVSDVIFRLGEKFDDETVGVDRITARRTECWSLIRFGSLSIDYK